MRCPDRGAFRRQARFLRHQFLQDGGLPFCDVLSEDAVARSLAAIKARWLDRVYSPLVTLWVFLGQVLSADHSCRAAVARLIAHRLGRGQPPCSAETGAYCQARKRLPEEFLVDLARQSGRSLDAGVEAEWLWKSRRVYVYDGSSVSMPDTAENQREYPQPICQKPGLGFPLARIAAVFSLACDAVLDLGICRYAGKGQSELGMLRTLWDVLRPGDVMLADRHRDARKARKSYRFSKDWRFHEARDREGEDHNKSRPPNCPVSGVHYTSSPHGRWAFPTSLGIVFFRSIRSRQRYGANYPPPGSNRGR